MTPVKEGDTIKVHYIGTVADGTEFDNSYKRKEPLEFTIGSSQIIPGFETAIVGMEIGEKKDITLGYAEAYGPHQKELLVVVPLNELPPGMKPKVGQMLKVSQADGQEFAASIIALTEQEVTMDANHPLAGKNLKFAIEVLEILPKPSCDCEHHRHHH
jgi:peptidylprolyl isomerase